MTGKPVGMHPRPSPTVPVRRPQWDSRYFYQRNYLKFIPTDRSASILELGIGDGSFLRFLYDLGYRDLTGVDISKESVENLERAGVCREMAVSDANRFLVATARVYDVIFAKDVIEHIDPTDVLELLFLAHQHLTEGGALIVKTLNASNPFSFHIRYNDLTHRTGFTETSLTQGFLASGFSEFRFLAERSPVVKNFAFSEILRTPLRMAWRVVTYCAEASLRFAYLVFGRPSPDVVAPGIIGIAWRSVDRSAGS